MKKESFKEITNLIKDVWGILYIEYKIRTMSRALKRLKFDGHYYIDNYHKLNYFSFYRNKQCEIDILLGLDREFYISYGYNTNTYKLTLFKGLDSIKIVEKKNRKDILKILKKIYLN